MNVAYLINQYPQVSHSFIRREIHALERQGVTVLRVALRGWSGALADPADELEREKTKYALRGGAPALLTAIMRMLLARPGHFWRALKLTWQMSRGAERPFHIHLIYLAEACRIAPWLQAAKTKHLHAHFGTNSATVAMLVHALGGPAFSFTAHGPEEFDKARAIGLPEKLRRASFVVAISSFGRSQLYRQIAHAYWPKVKVVHCGLEPSYFDGPFPTPNPRRLVCVGRLCEQKGQLLLVEAAARLRAKGVPFELVLAGDGELRREVEAAIAQHDMRPHVRITGWLSGAQVREEISAARALVLASFAEGLPVVLMEAMALKRPVISTFVAGIPELVTPGKDGWLAPAGDVEALTEALEGCLNSPADLIATMGEQAYGKVIARHHIDIEAAKLQGLFEGAIAGAYTKGNATKVN